jgi:LDH2 family malate/lactate/ureidoglycolate dehydrogenase
MNDELVEAGALLRFMTTVFEVVGMSEEDAAIAAEVLVAADLRGHESHGVARAEHYYVRPLQSGQIRARAELVTVRETAATLVLDAQNGMGHPAAKHAMDRCIAKARQAGTCLAVVRGSNHYGIAGYYPLQAATHDMIGLCSTTSGTLVVPTGGRNALLGSNPLAFAAPAGRQRPFMLDMATSVVPVGKVEVKARRGQPLPPGWAVDEQGRPTTDAEGVLERVHRGAGQGGLLPLGGLEAGHKGYGLSVMVDIISGLLAGAQISLNFTKRVRRGELPDLGHFVAAIDIAAFVPLDEFKRSMDAYIETLHAAPAAAGTQRVQVAGDPEFDTEERRRREGIPLHPKVAASLRDLGSELGVPFPARR